MDLVPLLNTGRCCIPSSPPLRAISNRRNFSQDIWWFSFPANALRKWKLGFDRYAKQDELSLLACSNWKKRKTFIYAVGQEAEKSFQSTVELDRLIDKLRVTNEQQLPKIVVENIFAFDSMFWTRLAARAELCESEDDKKDYEDLASSLMSIVERCVQKTTEKIESATDVLKAIIKPITNEDEEIVWPPRDPRNVILMKKELAQREQEGQLDEGFLSEVNAQLRQAKEDGDKPGLVAILQKVLQLYSTKVLSKRSYAYKDGEVIKAEEFLEAIIKANEEDWNGLLLNGLTVGTGRITPEEFNHVIDKRVERTLLRTESGSYQQRVLTEYLREIQSRTQSLVEAFQNQQPS